MSRNVRIKIKTKGTQSVHVSTAFLFFNVAFVLETARNLFCVGLFCLKINHLIKVYLIFGIEVFCKSGYILLI